MKLENAFLDSNLTIKVADFGLMKDYNNDVLKTKIGTEGYMAPEINLHKTYDGPPVDIFACGVMLFAMATGNQPFTKVGDGWHKLMKKNPVQFCEKRGIDN